MDGTATLMPPSADLNLALTNIDLRAISPYVHEQAALEITGGAFDLGGRARYASPEPGLPSSTLPVTWPFAILFRSTTSCSRSLPNGMR